MKNNKQIGISKQKRIKRLKLSYEQCHNSLTKLINKKVKTAFDLNEIDFFNNRLTKIRLDYYMEGVPCS